MTEETKREIERLKDREQEPLLDAVIWGNVMINDLLGADMLERKGNLFCSEKNPVKVVLPDGQTFCSLTINDSTIGLFKAGAILQKNTKIDYGTLATNVKNSLLGNMIGNTAEETIESLRDSLQMMGEKYGVVIDPIGITIKKMEIQRTFRLDDLYELYQRILKLIFAIIPPKSRLTNIIKFGTNADGTTTEQTFYVNSRSSKKSENYRELKVYDKGKERQEHLGITFDDTWVRIELTLIGGKTIKNAFGSRDLEIFADSIIADYFNSQMQGLIIKPYWKWKAKRDKELLKLLKEQRKRDPKRWINNSLVEILNREVSSGGVPFVLGIDEILAAVDQMGLERRNKSRVKKSFLLLGQRNARALMQGDDTRLREFIDKLDVTKCRTITGEKCDTQKVIETK